MGAILCAAIAGGCSREPQGAKAPAPKQKVVAATTLLATMADDEQLRSDASRSGHAGAPPVQGPRAFESVIVHEFGKGAAYVVERSGRTSVVRNGAAEKPYDSIGAVVLGPDGHRVAYAALSGGSWRMVVDGREDDLFDEVGEPVFSPDGKHLAYEARRGRRWYIVADGKRSAPALSYLEKPGFNADSSRILCIENTGNAMVKLLIVSDLSLERLLVKEVVGTSIIWNREKTRIAAVSSHQGGQRATAFPVLKPDDVTTGPRYDAVDFLSFGTDGSSLSYAALRGEHQYRIRYIVLNGKEDILPDSNLVGPPVVRPDNKGVGIIMQAREGHYLHQAFLRAEQGMLYFEEAGALVYSEDSRHHAFVARRGRNWFVVADGKEGPAFDRVVTPVFNPDGRFLVYRARKDGRRFVVVADAGGKVLEQHPPSELVFPPVFTDDGRSVAYGVKDGKQLLWMVRPLPK